MARILVTGGSGFIGTNLVEQLLRRGDDVLNVDCLPPRNPKHRGLWREQSVGERKRLWALARDFAPEVVFHCAARTDLDGPRAEDYAINVEGTQNVFDAVTDSGQVKRVIVLSSMLVCRLGYVPQSDEDYCPTTAYGLSKAQAERRVRANRPGVPWVIARPTSIWGPWFGAPYLEFFRAVARGRFRAPRSWHTRRSLGFVANTVDQLLSLAEVAEAQVAGKTFYVCDYPPVRMDEWAAAVADALQVSRPAEVDTSLLRVAARGGDLLRLLGIRHPPLTSLRLNNMLTEAVFDPARLQAVCRTPPCTIQEGIAQTVDWMRGEGLV